MIDGELVDFAGREVGRREREGQIARRGDPPRIAVVEQGRAGGAEQGVGLVLGGGDGLDDDTQLVARTWRSGSWAPMTPSRP